MTKMTKKVALEIAMTAIHANEIKEYHFAGSEISYSAQEAIEKLLAMSEALDRKPTSGEKRMTENQRQNVGYRANIMELLSDGVARTASEILKSEIEFPIEMSIQRVTAMLRQLTLDGQVEREKVKGVTYFKKVEPKAEEEEGE